MIKLKKFLGVTLSAMMLLVCVPGTNVKAEGATKPPEIVVPENPVEKGGKTIPWIPLTPAMPVAPGNPVDQGKFQLEKVIAYDKDGKTVELVDGGKDIPLEISKIEIGFTKPVNPESVNTKYTCLISIRPNVCGKDPFLKGEVSEKEGKGCVTVLSRFDKYIELTENSSYKLRIPKNTADMEGNKLGDSNVEINFTTIKDDTLNSIEDFKIDGELVSEGKMYSAKKLTGIPKEIAFTCKKELSGRKSNLINSIILQEFVNGEVKGKEIKLPEDSIKIEGNKCSIDLSSIKFDSSKIYQFSIFDLLMDKEGKKLRKDYCYSFIPGEGTIEDDGKKFDLNKDGKTNVLDLIMVTRTIGVTNKDAQLWEKYKDRDLNADGKIDEADADMIKACFNKDIKIINKSK